MNRKMFILNSADGTVGFAKITHTADSATLFLQLKKQFDSAFTPFIICNKKALSPYSVLKNKALFHLSADDSIDGVILKDNDKNIAWSGENYTEATSDITEDHELTFENFFGGGFSWQRIRGNFVVHNYSIIHHILAQKDIYSAINRCGYYCAGYKETEAMKMIAFAIPTEKIKTNPFSQLNTETYFIHSGKKEFYAICIGIDKTGEFFLTY